MRREDLEHLVRAAADITGDEIVVIGSQAVLAQFPDPPAPLTTSLEADVFPLHDPEKAHEIDGALGDGSQFHRMNGYFAHGVGPETLIAPEGWEQRLVQVPVPAVLRSSKTATGWGLEIHDLVLSKLAAGRARDIEYATEAIRAEMADREELLSRIDCMPRAHRDPTRERLNGVLRLLDRAPA